MIRVITVSREYGSGGGTLASMLGDRLGWRVLDNPLVSEITGTALDSAAAIQRYEETVDPWMHRVVKALWRGGFMGASTRTESEALDADATAKLWSQVILEAAEIGNCITVGRGGQCLLQKRSDAFHVYAYGPMSDRLRRIRRREPAGTDLRAAARDRDRRRAEYIRHYFGQDWTNPHLYHLMVCTGIGLEQAADAILAAAGLLA